MASFCIWLTTSNFQTFKIEPTPPLVMVLIISGESV
jgi:hypothetical protein